MTHDEEENAVRQLGELIGYERLMEYARLQPDRGPLMPIEQTQTSKEVEALADAMWQLLDDMGARGQNVCLGAKAQARVAFEPFRDTSEPEYDDWMSLEQAKQILKECDG